MHIEYDPNGKRCEECGVGYAFGMSKMVIARIEFYLCDSCMKSALNMLKDEVDVEEDVEDDDE